LIDDYNKNLEGWERDGGTAIKAKNNINHRGLYGALWNGELIDVTDTADSIVERLTEIIVSREKEKTLSDYTLSSDDYSDLGGEKSRFRHNIEAIKTLKAIESENRNATPDEQKVLAKYVGWGGLSAAFNADNKSWADEYNEVSELLTSEEYANARESTMTAFYTSPEIIGAVYDGLKSIGFDGGNILDPSAGTGNFFGAMPIEMREKSKLYGVELDSVSARIAKQLYQSANITEGAYEKRVLNDNFYDAAISNVPFGQFKVHDKRYDSLNLNIHDYFFAKSLDKVRPGGVIAFITTSGTLDKSNSKFRKYMAERAELLGAVRLPNTAFKVVAGTEVTSDIIFLQKRDKIQSVNSENCEWLDLDTDENGIPMNSYFVNHPDMIIGEMKQGIEYSMYGDATATACVAPEGYDIVSHLHNAVTRIDGEYHPYTPQQDEIKYGELKKETIPADESVDNYTYTLYNGNVYYRENSIMTKVDKGADRIAAMIDLKTITRSLLQQQLLGYEQSDIDNTRKELNEHYDAFVKKYGYVNSKANETAFSADSSYYLLRSLEKFDKTDNTYNGKADIFIKNTVRPVKTVVSVSTAVESIGVSLCEKGCIDIPYMASLCGLSEEQTIKDCIDAGAIYKVPPFPPRPDKTDIYVTADEYLSGNIRDKLAFARTAALTNNEYEHNVEALEKVMPAPLTASDIDIRIGVTWLDPEYYNNFIRDTFDAYLYQIIENKQKGISQIMTSKTPVRNCEDVDEAVLNYSEVKALCTGNPLIKERMELDIDISKLKRLQSAYLSEKYSLEDKLLKIYPQRKADAEKYIANTAIDAESYKQYSEEFTEIVINGVTFTDKKEAANALLHTIRTVGSTDLTKIGTYKGYDMKVSFDGAYGVYYVTMVGKARYTWQVRQDPLRNLTRMENTLKSIGNVHEKAIHDLDVINRDIATAEEFVRSPWAREKELSEKSARLREVDRLIAEAEKNGQPNGQNKDIEEEQEM
jgi:phospholipid N-methyltransferase